MANSKFVLACTVQDSAQAVKDTLNLARNSPALLLQAISQYFQDMSSGITSSSIVVQQTAIAAAGTVTFSSFVADDTVTVGATTLTGKASPANENQFLSTGTDDQDAIAFAACVNAHSVLSKYVSAARTSSGVATVTSLIPGVIGNGLALAISAHGSVVAFASGANDANVTISHGI
jgi:hypothetical protein